MVLLNYLEILKGLTRRGADYSEFFRGREESFSLLLEDGRVEKVIQGAEEGLGLRVLVGGRTYYTFSQNVSSGSGLTLAKELAEAMAVGKRSSRPRSKYARGALPIPPPRRQTTGLSPPALTAQVREVDRMIRKFHPGIRQVVIAGREHQTKVRIQNSLGDDARDHRLTSIWAVQVIAADGAVIQTGYETAGGNVGLHKFPPHTLEEIALTAARRAVQMLSARRAPGGRMPVILAAEAGGTMVHEAIGHGLEADLVQEKFSIYSGRRGQRVANPLISVVDDPTLPGRRGSYLVDDEGVSAQQTMLVERGVLKTFLYDRLTAHKEGRASNGHGRRQSYHYRPVPRMSNTMILPGREDPEKILAELSRGLLVKKMGGGQVNTVNGDFVFEVTEGYQIEGGEAAYPVRGATLIGNGAEVLRQIDRVGSDLGFGLGTCGKEGQGVPVADAQPTLRIPEITVGGSTEPVKK
jgi:TldD protein